MGKRNKLLNILGTILKAVVFGVVRVVGAIAVSISVMFAVKAVMELPSSLPGIFVKGGFVFMVGAVAFTLKMLIKEVRQWSEEG